MTTEEKKNENQKLPVFRMSLDCPNIVDPLHKTATNEEVPGEILTDETNARGRRVVVQRFAVTRTTQDDPVMIGDNAINRLRFHFASERRPTCGLMLIACNLELKIAYRERVGGDALSNLIEELRGQREPRADQEILALMQGRQCNQFTNYELADLPPIAKGKNGLDRFRDKVEVYRVTDVNINPDDFNKSFLCQFPANLFLRAQGGFGELMQELGSHARIQGVNLYSVMRTTDGEEVPRPGRFLVVYNPHFARERSTGKIVAIDEPGLVLVLDSKAFNRINPLFYWTEKKVRGLMEAVTSVTDADMEAEQREREARAAKRGRGGSRRVPRAQEATPNVAPATPPVTPTETTGTPPPVEAAQTEAPPPTEQPPATETAVP